MKTSELKEIVKNNISQAIAMSGSQSALAKKALLSQGAISKYLRGASLPSGVAAKNLSIATDGKIEPSGFAPHIFN